LTFFRMTLIAFAQITDKQPHRYILQNLGQWHFLLRPNLGGENVSTWPSKRRGPSQDSIIPELVSKLQGFRSDLAVDHPWRDGDRKFSVEYARKSYNVILSSTERF
jgi:hypothetical protein